MRKLLLLALLMFAPAGFAQVAIPITNASSTGTTVNQTAIVNASNQAIIATTTSNSVPTYIVVAGAGTTGQAQLALSGPALCVMDATTSSAGWYYVVNSTTTAGYCHPQSAAPTAGNWVIGYLQAASTTTGVTGLVNVNSYVYGGSGGGGGTTTNALTINNSGSGATSGAAFNGGAAITLSYNSIGAAPSNSPTFSGTVTIPAMILSSITGSSQCLQVSSSGLVSGAGSSCATSAGTVTGVSNGDGTLTISPTTGAVVASIALAHANTWTATQTFSGIVDSNVTGSTQCLQANSSGLVSGTGASCGSGGSGTVNSGIAGHISFYSSSGTAVSSDTNLDDGATTVNTLTYAGTGGITSPSLQATASGAGVVNTYNSAGSFFTSWSSAATANNTINGFSTTPVTGDLVSCVSSGTTCTLTDSGVLASALVTASSTTTFTNKSISGGQINSGLVGATFGGTGFNSGSSTGVAQVSGGTWSVAPLSSLTVNSGGSGAASGSTFNGTSALTVSYNTIGAAPLASPTFTGIVTTPALTLSAITGSTQCLQVNTSGVVAGSGGACGGGGGGLPTGTTGQGVYYAAGGTTGTASSATTTTNAASGFAYGINDTTPVAFDIGGAAAQFANYTGTVTLGATCGATATSCTISGGANLAPNGGYLLISYANGSNNQEFVCYSAATSTTLTIGGGNCQTPVTTTGRSYFGSTAASHNSGDQIVQVLKVLSSSVSGNIYEVVLGNGANGAVAILPGSANNFSAGIGLMTNSTIQSLGGFAFSTNPSNSNGGFGLGLANAALAFRNTNANAAWISNANVSRNVSTQSIATTGTFATNATAITAAVTEAVPNNNTTASNTVGGQLQATCQIFWQQATGVSTAQFGVKLSAAPTSLTVIDEDYNGTSLTSSVPTVITTTTVTSTSPAITPAAINTTYWTRLTLIMDPGTSNSPTVTLYGNSGNASDAVVIQKGSGCTGWI
jgi:hypothetical protein